MKRSRKRALYGWIDMKGCLERKLLARFNGRSALAMRNRLLKREKRSENSQSMFGCPIKVY